MIKEFIYERRNINNYGIHSKVCSLNFLDYFYNKLQSYYLSNSDEELEIYKKCLKNKRFMSLNILSFYPYWPDLMNIEINRS